MLTDFLMAEMAAMVLNCAPSRNEASLHSDTGGAHQIAGALVFAAHDG
jgi:hypothetical protein